MKNFKNELDIERPIRKSTRNKDGLSDSGMIAAKFTMEIEWKKLIKAGEMDGAIEIESEGERSCGAMIYLYDDEFVEGKFTSDDCHAEMDGLQKVIARGDELRDIERIEIEKQPCPRCAVVLNNLGLSHLVFYKSAGQKDYPTWRYPKISKDPNFWAKVMGVSGQAKKAEHQKEILNHFRYQKWW